MRRPAEYSSTHWDDPFWQTVRMFVDVLGGQAAKSRDRPPTEPELLQALDKKATSASEAFARHLADHPELTARVGDYLFARVGAVENMLRLLRTEELARADLIALDAQVAIAQYATQSGDHHQSSKVIVATVDWLTTHALRERDVTCDLNPQSRAVVFEPGRMMVSARRLDGAIPGLLNPSCLWEIKEYWGGSPTQGGGSKMSDAIYECQLVGTDLRAYEDKGGTHVGHYLIFDGLYQWQRRRSDLARAYDLLACGLLDELIVGREVLVEWPRIVRETADQLGKGRHPRAAV